MRRFIIIILIALALHESILLATSTIYFSGGKYLIRVVVSDTSSEVTNLWLFRRKKQTLFAEPGELDGAQCDMVKQTIRVVLPAKADRPSFELTATGEKGLMKLGNKTVELSCEWEH